MMRSTVHKTYFNKCVKGEKQNHIDNHIDMCDIYLYINHMPQESKDNIQNSVRNVAIYTPGEFLRNRVYRFVCRKIIT